MVCGLFLVPFLELTFPSAKLFFPHFGIAFAYENAYELLLVNALQALPNCVSLRIGSRAFQKRLQAASAKSHHSPCRKSGTFQNKKAATVSDSRRVGYTILLAVVLFLFAYNRSAGHNAAADKEQSNPKSQITCVSGLGRVGLFRQLFDLLS